MPVRDQRRGLTSRAKTTSQGNKLDKCFTRVLVYTKGQTNGGYVQEYTVIYSGEKSGTNTGNSNIRKQFAFASTETTKFVKILNPGNKARASTCDRNINCSIKLDTFGTHEKISNCNNFPNEIFGNILKPRLSRFKY